tara:strand:- start:94 stop:360 length:267 start_codon:yes stop_codon:yes gene_type:complete
MLIPIRCFTCNNKIANKWNKYEELLTEKRKNLVSGEKEEQILTTNIIENIKVGDKAKSIKGEVLDELGLTRYCCRRHFIGHIELIQFI